MKWYVSYTPSKNYFKKNLTLRGIKRNFLVSKSQLPCNLLNLLHHISTSSNSPTDLDANYVDDPVSFQTFPASVSTSLCVLSILKCCMAMRTNISHFLLSLLKIQLKYYLLFSPQGNLTSTFPELYFHPLCHLHRLVILIF